MRRILQILLLKTALSSAASLCTICLNTEQEEDPRTLIFEEVDQASFLFFSTCKIIVDIYKCFFK